jgi:hypothetical protein
LRLGEKRVALGQSGGSRNGWVLGLGALYDCPELKLPLAQLSLEQETKSADITEPARQVIKRCLRQIMFLHDDPIVFA